MYDIKLIVTASADKEMHWTIPISDLFGEIRQLLAKLIENKEAYQEEE